MRMMGAEADLRTLISKADVLAQYSSIQVFKYSSIQLFKYSSIHSFSIKSVSLKVYNLTILEKRWPFGRFSLGPAGSWVGSAQHVCFNF